MNWKTKLSSTKNNLLCLLLALVVIGCSQSPKEKQSRVANLPYYKDANFTPHWYASDSDSLQSFHQIPPFQLIDQEGDTITERTFQNKIYVTDFFFTTCPGICPRMTDNMGLLQEAFKTDTEVLLLSHSVTPEYDSVSILKNYALERDIISSKWHLVTGERTQIYGLGRNAYFVEEDLGLEKEPEDFLHTENFVLIDHNRHIRGIYNGLNKTDISQLIADIKTLKEEI
ncbi:MAG: SCO family protein [Chitinophagales bacterium]